MVRVIALTGSGASHRQVTVMDSVERRVAAVLKTGSPYGGLFIRGRSSVSL